MAKEEPQCNGINTVAREEWRSYIGRLNPLVDQFIDRLTDPSDAGLRHELYRQCVGQLAAGYFGLLYADARHPDFWPYFSSAFSHLGPNPDNDWYVTPVDDCGVYRLSGFRGSVKRVDFQLGTGTFTPRGVLDEDGHGKTTANYDLDSLVISPDGSFEVILSPARPPAHTGDWWQLHPRTSCIMVRQISYDWINEIDARLAIERLDTPTVKPRASPEELSQSLQQLSTWVITNVKTAFDFVREFRNAGWVNSVGYKDLTNWGAITTQRYVYGIFELDEDEALIFECDIPDVARYWSIQLTDELLVSIDWMNRQSSINGHTARRDSDGRFRAVISARDPGIANWLDSAGYRVGTIQNRWDSCSSWPSPITYKVKFDRVHDHLPSDTIRVSETERTAAIRLRRKACQLRKRW